MRLWWLAVASLDVGVISRSAILILVLPALTPACARSHAPTDAVAVADGGCEVVEGPNLLATGAMQHAATDLLAHDGDVFWFGAVHVFGYLHAEGGTTELAHNARGPLYGIHASGELLYYGGSTRDGDALMAFDRHRGSHDEVHVGTAALDVTTHGDSLYVASCGGVVRSDGRGRAAVPWPLEVTGACPVRIHATATRLLVESADGLVSLDAGGGDRQRLSIVGPDALFGARGDDIFVRSHGDSVQGGGVVDARAISRTSADRQTSLRPRVVAEPDFTITDAALGATHLYWLEYAQGGSDLRCTALDGGEVRTLAWHLDSATQVAVAGDRVYWLEARLAPGREVFETQLWVMRVGPG